MNPDPSVADPGAVIAEEPPAPACVMSFNASDASGAGGSAGDIATISAMGAHTLPVITSIVLRDSAEVFDQHPIEAEHVAEQARTILEDVTLAAWKVGFLGNADNVAAVAEILSDYPDVPLVAYMPTLGWVDEDELQNYMEAFRELILPAAEVLVGNHKTLTDFLLPDWDNERAPSARELAVAAGEHGTRFVLVTGVMLPSQGQGAVDRQRAGLAAGRAHRREVRALRSRLRRRRRHAVGGAGGAAGFGRGAVGRRRRSAAVSRPEPGCGLPSRHGQRRARSLLLGAAAARGRRGRRPMANAEPDDNSGLPPGASRRVH